MIIADPIPSAEKTLQAAIRLLPGDKVIKVAPDAATRKVVDAPQALIPKIGIVDWLPAGDGTYNPVLRLHAQHIRVSIAAVVCDVHHLILRRLIRAGFVEGYQPSPCCCMINLHSYFDHLNRVAEDPEFWDEKRRARYSAAL